MATSKSMAKDAEEDAERTTKVCIREYKAKNNRAKSNRDTRAEGWEEGEAKAEAKD